MTISDAEKLQYRQLAQQQVFQSLQFFEQSSNNINYNKSQQLHNRPETEPGTMKLTRKGKEQIRMGLRKCSNRDLRVINQDPSNVQLIKSYEIAFLVKPLVYLGLWLDDFIPLKILRPIEEASNHFIRFPLAFHRFQWERLTRLFAARNNLLFLLVLLLVIMLLKAFLSLIF